MRRGAPCLGAKRLMKQVIKGCFVDSYQPSSAFHTERVFVSYFSSNYRMLDA